MRAGISIIAVASVAWIVTLATTNAPSDPPRLSAGEPLPDGLSLFGGAPARPPSEPVEAPPEPVAPPEPPAANVAPADAPPRFKPVDRAARPTVAARPFYVTSLDAASSAHSIARYSKGFPDPAGLVVAAKIDGKAVSFVHPSVTRDASGTYFLYALERRYGEPLFERIAVFTSRDGKKFSYRRAVFKGRAFSSAYFVFDDGVFRAWYTQTPGKRPGIYYAESRDGLHFREIGGARSRPRYIDYVVRDGSRWYALMTTGVPRQPDEPFLATFRDPREAHFNDIGHVARARPISARLARPARIGARELVIEPGKSRLRRGDAIVLERASAGPTDDVVQIESVDGATLRLRGEVRFDYEPGDEIRVADRRRVGPSFVCRARDGTWKGIFSASAAFPRLPNELTLAYRAPSIRGPWTFDRTAVAPLLTLENEQITRSVSQPTPVTESPDVTKCE